MLHWAKVAFVHTGHAFPWQNEATGASKDPQGACCTGRGVLAIASWGSCSASVKSLPLFKMPVRWNDFTLAERDILKRWVETVREGEWNRRWSVACLASADHLSRNDSIMPLTVNTAQKKSSLCPRRMRTPPGGVIPQGLWALWCVVIVSVRWSARSLGGLNTGLSSGETVPILQWCNTVLLLPVWLDPFFMINTSALPSLQMRSSREHWQSGVPITWSWLLGVLLSAYWIFIIIMMHAACALVQLLSYIKKWHFTLMLIHACSRTDAQASDCKWGEWFCQIILVVQEISAPIKCILHFAADFLGLVRHGWETPLGALLF